MSDNSGKTWKRKASRQFSIEEKKKIVEEFISSGLSAKVFAPIYDIRMETLAKWKSEYVHPERIKKTTLKRGGPYSLQERINAVESYIKSGLSQKDFSKIWGVSEVTLGRWHSLFQKHGPKGLEGHIFQDKFRDYKKRHHKKISTKLEEIIIKTKISNPNFGLRKVKNFLNRFEGLKVSTGAISRVLKDENIPLIEVVKKQRRSSERVRSFERATAMQLWQTDITSFVLARNGTRVYLTVFLDDYSRYIVAWNLQLRQTSEFVINTVLDGFQKHGKPEEILTDQGRQYFSWRGKCDFQRMLEKEGIKHVIARSHHPQTVGKCERLWETVGQEFWNRVRPQELSDARERLIHYFNHYNHFRPHQGIGGMVPADRFFGVESQVRKVLEDSIEQNSLRLALDEAPRSPVFLVGNIGGKSVSLHGEGGHLIFQSPDGVISKIKTNEFGFTQISGEENGRANIEKISSKEDSEETTTNDGEAGIADQNTLAPCERGREEIGPSDCHDYARILDGKTLENGSSEGVEYTDITSVADVTTSFERDAGGSSQATDDEEERYERESRFGHQSITEEDCRIGENNRDAGSFDCDYARDAGSQAGERTETSKEGEEDWRAESDTKTSSKERSVFGFWKKGEE